MRFIELKNHVSETSLGQIVDSGSDSQVFRRGDKVVKIYGGHVSFDMIGAYRDLTNIASEHLISQPFIGTLGFPDRSRMPFEVSVNPIISVSKIQDGVVGISRYISGLPLDILEGQPVSRYETREIDKDMENQVEAEFFLSLMKGVNGVVHFLNKLEIEFLMKRLTRTLNYALGSDDVFEVIPYNVKVRLNPKSREINLVVTDICASLASLDSLKARKMVLRSGVSL